jgi:hypothetical protein
MHIISADDPLLRADAIAKVESSLSKSESILAKVRDDIAHLESEFAAMRAHRDRERRAAEASTAFRKAQR